MTLFLELVVFVSHVVVLPLPILRTVFVDFGCGNTTINALPSDTLTTASLLTVWAGGHIRDEGLSYITILHFGTPGYDCAPLSEYRLYLGKRDFFSVQDHTLLKFFACRKHLYDLQVHILYT